MNNKKFIKRKYKNSYNKKRNYTYYQPKKKPFIRGKGYVNKYKYKFKTRPSKKISKIALKNSKILKNLKRRVWKKINSVKKSPKWTLLAKKHAKTLSFKKRLVRVLLKNSKSRRPYCFNFLKSYIKPRYKRVELVKLSFHMGFFKRMRTLRRVAMIANAKRLRPYKNKSYFPIARYIYSAKLWRPGRRAYKRRTRRGSWWVPRTKKKFKFYTRKDVSTPYNAYLRSIVYMRNFTSDFTKIIRVNLSEADLKGTLFIKNYDLGLSVPVRRIKLKVSRSLKRRFRPRYRKLRRLKVLIFNKMKRKKLLKIKKSLAKTLKYNSPEFNAAYRNIIKKQEFDIISEAKNRAYACLYQKLRKYKVKKKKRKVVLNKKKRRAAKKRNLAKYRKRKIILAKAKRNINEIVYQNRRTRFLTVGLKKHVKATLRTFSKKYKLRVKSPKYKTRYINKYDSPRHQRLTTTYKRETRRHKEPYTFFSKKYIKNYRLEQKEERRLIKKKYKKKHSFNRKKNHFKHRRRVKKKNPTRVSLVITNSRSNYFFTLTKSSKRSLHIQNTLKVFSSGTLKNIKTARKRRDMKTFVRLGVKVIRFLNSNQINKLNEIKLKFKPKKKYSAMRPYAIKKVLRLFRYKNIYTRMLKFQLLRPHALRPRAPKRRRK